MFQYKFPALTRDKFKDDLFKFMVEKFGPGFRIQLTGYFNGANVEITAAIGMDLEMISPKVLSFTQVILRVRVGLKDPGVRLECRMTYNNLALSPDTLTFMGAIEVIATGTLKLDFAMGGMIRNPYNFDYLAIGNFYLSAGYSFGATPLPSFQIGAEIWLGEIDRYDPENNKHAIKVQGYFGLDPNNPNDFWVYTKINALTLQQLSEAFKIGWKIPKMIADTGFPSGLTFSFTRTDKDIPAIGLFAPAGFFLSGKVNILGVEAWGKILIQSTVTEIDITMKQINWIGGYIKVQRSAEDDTQGPILFIRASSMYFRVRIEGYAEALGINAGVKINIQETQMEFELRGTMWPGIFDANVRFQLTYGNLNTVHALILAEVETSKFMITLKNAIHSFFTAAGKAADAAKAKAKAAHDRAQASLTEARAEVEQWKGKVKAWQDDLEVKHKALLAKKVEKTDCAAKCPKICFGYLEWNPKCWKVWHWWVGCPQWNSCYSMVNDLVCLAKCEIKKLAAAMMMQLEQAVMKIGIALAEVPKLLGSIANGVLAAAQVAVEASEHLTLFLLVALRAASNGIAWLAKYTVEELFFLKKLQLFAEITPSWTACVGYKIRATLFTYPITSDGKACLDGSFLKSLVTEVTDGKNSPEELAGISDTTKKIEDAGGKFRTVDDAEKQLKKTKSEAKKEVDSETSKRYDTEVRQKRWHIPTPEMMEYVKTLPKRTTVPTADEMEIINAANEPFDFDFRNKETESAFAHTSPWYMVGDLPVVGLDAKPQEDPTQTGAKRELHFGMNSGDDMIKGQFADKKSLINWCDNYLSQNYYPIKSYFNAMEKFHRESDMSPCERMNRALISYSDLTHGLVHSLDTMQKSHNDFNMEHSAKRRGLLDVQQHIAATESKHNMTQQEREDAYFWFDKASENIDNFYRKSEIAIKKQESFIMPLIRRQLDFILRKEKGLSFDDFTDVAHRNAMIGYRRSSIPHSGEFDGERTLSTIKKELVSVVSSNDQTVIDMKKKLHGVKANIKSMKSYAKQCRND